MILPIYTYGQPVLRKVARDIDSSYPDFKVLVDNMFATMYNADGIGLAAPQIGLDIRLFVIDLAPLSDNDDDNDEFKDFKRVFVNAEIEEYFGEEVSIDEGCLSIPGINEKVVREDSIKIKYLDENFEPHEEIFTGFKARCIQHEYDHIEGILFTDKISPIRKRMISSKLNAMLKGKVRCHYRIKAIK